MRRTARMTLDSFDTIIVIMFPDGTRASTDTRLLLDKMFKVFGIFPSVYIQSLRENYDPRNSKSRHGRAQKMGYVKVRQ